MSAAAPDDLNPSFLKTRSIVVLDRSGTRLIIGSPGELDQDVASALQFACGLAIDHVVLPSNEFEELLAGEAGSQHVPVQLTPTYLLDRDPPLSAALDHQNGAFPRSMGNTQSLFNRVGSAVSTDSTQSLSFGPLARLLEAGCLPIEAGREILALAHHGTKVDPDGQRIARALAEGRSLGEAIALSPGPVDYLPAILAACACERDQIDTVVKIAAWFADNDRRHDTVARFVVEIAALGGAASLVAFAITVPAGFAVVAVCAFLGLRVRDAIAGPQVTDGVRAEVLGLVATLAALKLPPMIAIRSAAAHLARRMPTWGKLPETREHLAQALALDPMARRLLLSGDLAESACHAANDHAERGDAAVARLRWQARGGALALLSIALVVALIP